MVCKIFGVLAQLGEHLPYKQGVTGSSPVGPIFYRSGFADVAQLAEQLICNQQVGGSIPSISSKVGRCKYLKKFLHLPYKNLIIILV